MDIRQAARFFDTVDFDGYNLAAGTWTLGVVKAQLKSADAFVSIWNRPTRKRMLQCAPTQIPAHSVIRCSDSGEVFLVGSKQTDVLKNIKYRAVINLHSVDKTGELFRWQLDGASNIVRAKVENAYYDTELRSVNENIDQAYWHYGHFFMFLPSDSTARKNDVLVTAEGEFQLVETYRDSGFIAARAVKRTDDRAVMTYTRITGTTYNTATQRNVETVVTSQVLGRRLAVTQQDIPDASLQSNFFKVQLDPEFIAFTPKVDDRITVSGVTGVIHKVLTNAVSDDTDISVVVRV